MRPIFLDNNATTPLLAEVKEAMLFDMDCIPRNPSSVTRWGREGRQLIIQARKDVARFFNVLPEEVIFTSGATESNNMLIMGFYARKKGPIITTKIEHLSILEPIKALLAPTLFLPVDDTGVPSLSAIEDAFKQNPSFMIIGGANNETGIRSDLTPIASLCQAYGIPLLVDGVALLGKSEFLPLPSGISALSFSSHKIHGPKGIGLVILRKPHKIPPLIRGGHQEMDMRAGTENLSGILGFTKALYAIDSRSIISIELLRNRFESTLKDRFNDIEINGRGLRVANTSNLYFPRIDGENLLIELDQRGIITSMGSACSSGSLSPSHVLLNMGYSKERALSSLRFSLSRLTTEEEIDYAIDILSSLLQKSSRTNANCLIC